MDDNIKRFSFVVVVGALVIVIMYYFTVPYSRPHLYPNLKVPNKSLVQSLKRSAIQSASSIAIAMPSEKSDEPKPELDVVTDPELILVAMRKERRNFFRHAQEQRVNLHHNFFRLFPPKFTCPYKEERIGEGRMTGKWVCGIRELYGVNNSDSKAPFVPNCVMYSFGVGPEVVFDETVLAITNCKIWAYDHTQKVKDGILPSRSSLSKDPRRMIFQRIGVKENKNLNMTYLKSIKELMDINWIGWIDILKMDVDGAEFGALNMLMDNFEEKGILPFDQLLVEIHAWLEYDLYRVVIPWFNRLEAMGLRAVHAERNPTHCCVFEYDFVNVRGKVFWNSSFSFFKNGWTNMKMYAAGKVRI